VKASNGEKRSDDSLAIKPLSPPTASINPRIPDSTFDLDLPPGGLERTGLLGTNWNGSSIPQRGPYANELPFLSLTCIPS
jgi:hypothetical protein